MYTVYILYIYNDFNQAFIRKPKLMPGSVPLSRTVPKLAAGPPSAATTAYQRLGRQISKS